MKKIVACILALFLLVGCSSSHLPEKMNQETYDIGVVALEAMEAYNSGTMSSDELYERLESCYNELDNLAEESDEIPYSYLTF